MFLVFIHIKITGGVHPFLVNFSGERAYQILKLGCARQTRLLKSKAPV